MLSPAPFPFARQLDEVVADGLASAVNALFDCQKQMPQEF